jgi:hypothetical protein
MTPFRIMVKRSQRKAGRDVMEESEVPGHIFK